MVRAPNAHGAHLTRRERLDICYVYMSKPAEGFPDFAELERLLDSRDGAGMGPSAGQPGQGI